MKIEEITKFLIIQDIFISKEQQWLLIEYVKLIKEWNKRINLISMGDEKFVEERHILSSFLFVKAIKELREKMLLNVVDLGSGAGLPGIVLSIMFPDDKILLIDSSRKRCLFLKKAKKELGLNFYVVNYRFEKWILKNQLNIDVIVARAVAPINKLVQLTIPLLEKKKTVLLMLKKCKIEEEMQEDFKNNLDVKVLNFSFDKISDYMKNKCILKMEYSHG